MRNFIPERMVRATGRMMRMNIDDGDIFIGEYANGAIGSIQTSFVTIGNYPGIEARMYGERGRDHLPAGRGVRRGRDDQDRHARRGRVQASSEIPQRFYPPGGHPRESWRSLFYANLITRFHRRDPRRAASATRATSRTAPGSRKPSTPSSGRSTSAAGSICRSTDECPPGNPGVRSLAG